ncbi:hypothetical protein [Enterococcus durans]|uniref:hypothetical protein n=1 Tax=Enterococcus durans TaxID=53345 RepID=UPI001C0335D4|nr:hypothetical protein [Enterococcus durans]
MNIYSFQIKGETPKIMVKMKTNENFLFLVSVFMKKTSYGLTKHLGYRKLFLYK